jgi:hypothetical protein
MSFSVSRRSSTGDLHTANRVIHIPDMMEGSGWYYRPAAARTDRELASDTNKTFGRSSNGRRNAEDWLRTFYIQKIEPHLQLPILAIDRPFQFRELTRVSNDALVAFGTLDPVWGWFGVGYSTATVRRNSERKDDAVKIASTGHPGQKLSMEGFWPTGYDTTEFEYQSYGPNNLREAQQHIARLVQQVPDWRDMPDDEWVQDGNKAYYLRKEGKWCADDTTPRDIVLKGLPGLRDTFQAMRFLGVDVTERFSYTGDSRTIPILNSLTIHFTAKELASNDPHHNNFGHIIYITSGGASIRCGYVEDEERWVEHEKRQAQQQLIDMINAPTTETYTITPRKEAT